MHFRVQLLTIDSNAHISVYRNKPGCRPELIVSSPFESSSKADAWIAGFRTCCDIIGHTCEILEHKDVDKERRVAELEKIEEIISNQSDTKGNPGRD